MSVLDEDTGQQIEYHKLCNHSKFKKTGTNPTPTKWDACAKALGRALTEKSNVLTALTLSLSSNAVTHPTTSAKKSRTPRLSTNFIFKSLANKFSTLDMLERQRDI